jgi:hypothetical protein
MRYRCSVGAIRRRVPPPSSTRSAPNGWRRQSALRLFQPSHGLRIDGLSPQVKHTRVTLRAAGQFPEAMRLTTEATMTEPKTYDNSPWRRAVARIRDDVRLVSEIAKLIPTA